MEFKPREVVLIVCSMMFFGLGANIPFATFELQDKLILIFMSLGFGLTFYLKLSELYETMTYPTETFPKYLEYIRTYIGIIIPASIILWNGRLTPYLAVVWGIILIIGMIYDLNLLLQQKKKSKK